MKEYWKMLFVFAILALVFKVVFFNESVVVVLRFVVSLFWLFIFPGYILMTAMDKKLDFLEHLLMGTGFAAAVLGVVSYFLGIFGLHIRYHFVIIPLIMICAGLGMHFLGDRR